MRTTKQSIFILSIIIFTFYSCKKVEKDVMDYYPEVKTISATILQDGSVEVIGEVITEGASSIDYIGFCANVDTIPLMLDSQIMEVTIIDNRFSAIYYIFFQKNRRYYFRTWISNDYGYSYGNSVYIDK